MTNPGNAAGAAVEIVGDSGWRVRLSVTGYEDPSRPPAGAGDVEWLSGSALAEGPGFEARVGASFEAEDFVRFAAEVDAVREGRAGEAWFRTLEEQVELKLVRGRHGDVEVTGSVTEHARAHLDFRFASDLASLDRASPALREIVRRFPPRR